MKQYYRYPKDLLFLNLRARRKTRILPVGLGIILLLTLSACGVSETREIQEPETIPQASDASLLLSSSGYSSGNLVTIDDAYYDAPQAGQNYIFALNPGGGSVTLIDADSLSIRVLETGARPTFLQVLDGTDKALIINSDSNDLSFVEVLDNGEAQVETVEIVEGANTINVSPDGAYAVVYFDSLKQDLTSDFGDFQTVSVLFLNEAKIRSETLSVGFLPRDVYFNEDNTNAYVVTDDGVSILDFDNITQNGAGIAPSVVFATGNYADETDNFYISPDGAYAIYKKVFGSSLQMTDLETGIDSYLDYDRFFRWDFNADLGQYTPHWTGELFYGANFIFFSLDEYNQEAWVIESNSKKVLNIPIPEGIENPALCTIVDFESIDLHLSSLVPDRASNRLLVYDDEFGTKSLAVLDLSQIPSGIEMAGMNPDDTDTLDTDSTDTDTVGTDTGDTELPESVLQLVPTRKGIDQIVMMEDSQTAFIGHTRRNADPMADDISVDERIDRSYGYTLLQTETLDSKLQLVDALPHTIIRVPSTNIAYLLFASYSSDIVKEVQKVNLESFVIDPPIRLESRPVSGGYVETAGKIFINQEHPEGRITLIDVATGELSTVTGFILNSKIKD